MQHACENDAVYLLNFLSFHTVKSEVKLEDRINGIEIKDENTDKSNSRLKYPDSIGEFFDRNSPQLFLMQVK